MKELVVDSGILIKTLITEAYSDAAIRCFKSATRLIAPDLIWIEASNVIWKKTGRGEIDASNVDQILQQMLRAPIDTHGSYDLVRRAAALAIETSRTVYDCMYLGLAIREGLSFLTADERFVNALRGTRHERHVHFIGE